MCCLFRKTIFSCLLQVSYSIFFFFLDFDEEKMRVYFCFSKDTFDDLLEGFWRKDVEDPLQKKRVIVDIYYLDLHKYMSLLFISVNNHDRYNLFTPIMTYIKI